MSQKEKFKAVFAELAGDRQKVTAEEMVKIFKSMGKNIYKPSMVKYILLSRPMEMKKNAVNVEADCEMGWQIFEVAKDPIKSQIWKKKNHLLSFSYQMKQQLGEIKVHDRQSRGNLSVKIGEITDPKLSVNIHLSQHKKKMSEEKMNFIIFIEIIDESKISQAVECVKNLKDFVWQMLSEQQPDFQIISKSLDVKIEGKQKGLQIILTVSEPDLKQLIETIMLSTNMLFGCYLDGEINVEFQNQFDIVELIKTKNEGFYSLLRLIAFQTRLKVEWDSGDIMTGLKKIVNLLHGLDDFQYDKTNPICLALLLYLNSQMISGQFQFQNAKIQQELPQIIQAKQQLFSMIDQAPSMLQSFGIDFHPFLSNIGEKITVTATLGDLNAKISLFIKGLNQAIKLIIASDGRDADSEDS